MYLCIPPLRSGHRRTTPLYDQLFGAARQTGATNGATFEELVLMLRCARAAADGGASAIKFLLLDVRVEASLAPDRALLVWSCEHIGVELSREVFDAITAAEGRTSKKGRVAQERREECDGQKHRQETRQGRFRLLKECRTEQEGHDHRLPVTEGHGEEGVDRTRTGRQEARKT